MSNEKREQQMMAAAEMYAEEVKATFTGSDEDKHQERLVTINDFCAGWRAADNSRWIPVKKKLPPKRKDPVVISDEVYIHTIGGHYLSAVYDYQDKEWIDVYNIETLKSSEVIHWMPIIPPRKEE